MLLVCACVQKKTGKTLQHDEVHSSGEEQPCACCLNITNPPKKYQGHYVVVCGVDPPNKKIYFTDPAGEITCWTHRLNVLENTIMVGLLQPTPYEGGGALSRRCLLSQQLVPPLFFYADVRRAKY